MITIKARIYSPGDSIIFRGMIIQAYDPTNGTLIGSFRAGDGLKLLKQCNAVTHKDAKEKKAVTLYWIPPENATGQVAFKGTIVQKFTVYFQNLKAQLDPVPFK